MLLNALCARCIRWFFDVDCIAFSSTANPVNRSKPGHFVALWTAEWIDVLPVGASFHFENTLSSVSLSSGCFFIISDNWIA